MATRRQRVCLVTLWRRAAGADDLAESATGRRMVETRRSLDRADAECSWRSVLGLGPVAVRWVNRRRAGLEACQCRAGEIVLVGAFRAIARWSWIGWRA